MARIDNLDNFLTDVADAIRVKTGDTEQIDAADFDTEIVAINTVHNQNKTIIPTTSRQEVTADSGYTGIEVATVEAVTSAIDSDIVSNNIKSGVTILGVTGNVVELNGEVRTVKSTTYTQNISPSSGKNAITKVTVNPIVLESKSVKSGTEAQIISPASGKDGFNRISVEPIELETKTVKSTTVAQTIEPTIGKDGISGITVEPIVLEERTVAPMTSPQVIIPATGKDGISKISVDPVTNLIDANITPGNIRMGVEILGVTGNMAPDKPDQTKTVTPTTSEQVIVSDTGYELVSVTVNAVDNTIDSNIQSGNIKAGVTILGVTGENGIVDTSDATAVAANLLHDKTAYVNGQKITGTIIDYSHSGLVGEYFDSVTNDASKQECIVRGRPVGAGYVSPIGTTLQVTIPYSNLASALSLTSDKIKKGENVLGIEGTYAPASLMFSSVEEMEAYEYPVEDLYAIVYGTSYIGTYRYDNGSWTKLGGKTDWNEIMDILNYIAGTTDQYEGEGGTEQQISDAIDSIWDSSDGRAVLAVLNEVEPTGAPYYEGQGGTKEEIMGVFNDILGNGGNE